MITQPSGESPSTSIGATGRGDKITTQSAGVSRAIVLLLIGILVSVTISGCLGGPLGNPENIPAPDDGGTPSGDRNVSRRDRPSDNASIYRLVNVTNRVDDVTPVVPQHPDTSSCEDEQTSTIGGYRDYDLQMDPRMTRINVTLRWSPYRAEGDAPNIDLYLYNDEGQEVSGCRGEAGNPARVTAPVSNETGTWTVRVSNKLAPRIKYRVTAVATMRVRPGGNVSGLVFLEGG